MEEIFHFDLEGTIIIAEGDGETGIPVTFVGDVAFPDRSRAKLTVSLGFFSLEFEGIVIGDDTYTTDLQTGEWVVGKGVVSALPNPAQIAEAAAAALGEDLRLGEAMLEGARMHHIQGVPPESLLGGPETEVQIEVWIGVEDNLIRQIAGEGVLSAEGAGDALSTLGIKGEARIAMTMTLSGYGEPVVIEAPEMD